MEIDISLTLVSKRSIGTAGDLHQGGSKQNFRDHALLRVCHLEFCKVTLQSFLAIALNTKFVPGKSIFLVCRSVPNSFLGDFGLTFLPTKVVAEEWG